LNANATLLLRFAVPAEAGPLLGAGFEELSGWRRGPAPTAGIYGPKVMVIK